MYELSSRTIDMTLFVVNYTPFTKLLARVVISHIK